MFGEQTAQIQNEILYHVQCDLYNLDTLNPQQFIQQLLPLPIAGIQDRILFLIRQAIHEFPLERAILKYVRIIDKLIRVPTFMTHLQHLLVDIYSECFVYIGEQKSTADLEELKLLRKYWVGQVHPMLLWQIKQRVMERTGIDVDAGIRADRVKHLKAHYVKLGLKPEEIQYHLEGGMRSENSPGRQLSKPRGMETQPSNSYFASPSRFPPSYPQSQQQQHFSQQHQLAQHEMTPSQQWGLRGQSPSVSQTRSQPQQKQLTGRGYGIQQQRLGEVAAYMRQPQPGVEKGGNWGGSGVLLGESVGDDASLVGGGAEPPQPPVRRVIHDYHFMLSNLKTINPHECRECGMRFITPQQHSAHQQSHFDARLAHHTSPTSLPSLSLSTPDSWVSGGEMGHADADFCLELKLNEVAAQLCSGCGGEMEVAMRGGSWVYINAIRVKVHQSQALMHKSCQKTLTQ